MARAGVLLAALAVLAGSVAALYDAKDDVVQLTSKDFDKTVLKSPGLFLVEFYAPWCGHCKNLAPEWKKAAKALKGIITVVAVDAQEHQDVGSKYGVQGFPTIKLFGENKKSPIDYNGGRDAASIVNWALQQAQTVARSRLGIKGGSSGSGSGGSKPKGDRETGGGKAVVTLTPENFDSLVLGSGEAWMVEFYAPWCGHCKNLAPEWASAAEQVAGEGVKFGAVDADKHKELAQRFGIRGFPTIKMFKAGSSSDSDGKDYNGGRTASDLVAAAQSLAAAGGGAAAKVTEVTSAAVWEDLCGGGKGKRVCLLAILPHILDDQSAKRNARIAALTEAAASLRGKPFRFLWAEVGAHPKLEAALNVGLTPALYALTADKPVYSTHRGAFEAGAISSFAQALLAGKSTVASAPLPASFELKAAFAKVAPWDGKDAVPPAEEEL